MKKILAVLLFTSCSMAFAQHHGHRHFGHHHRYWHPHYGWIVPAIIGGTVVYAATRPDPAPVVVQQPTVVLQPNQVLIDGVVYTKQIMVINGVQQEVLMKQ